MKKINYFKKKLIYLLLFLLFFSSVNCSNLTSYRKTRGPKIAFIIDDVGYHTAYKKYVLNIDAPITYAVIPYTPSAKIMDRFLNENGYRTMVHLSLEPRGEGKNKERGMIYSAMTAKEIKELLNKNIKNIPLAKGVNNHKGSKITADRRVMRIILEELKNKRLFFVDSVTTSGSVCEQVAQELNMRIGKRDIFLDNEDDIKYIKKQIRKLEHVALKYGEAIGIGHYRQNTLQAIDELIPEIEGKGIQVVFISDLLR